MISSNHSTDEKQIVAPQEATPPLPPPPPPTTKITPAVGDMTSMANRTPEKMPHVTSSAAIAPGCSAQWGRGGGGERHRERQMVGSGQKYRNMAVTLKPGASPRRPSDRSGPDALAG